MENITIDDILTEKQITDLYQIVDATGDDSTVVQTRLGHRAYLVDLGEPLRLHLEKIIQDRYGNNWSLNAYQFARYSKKFGYEPKLYPHFDDGFEEHKLTLDVQVRSTVQWPIVVEGKEFTLKNNQAVVFSGTDQVHWRSALELSDSDEVDMIFCHFSDLSNPDRAMSPEHIAKMEAEEKVWQEKVQISTAPVLVDSEANGE